VLAKSKNGFNFYLNACQMSSLQKLSLIKTSFENMKVSTRTFTASTNIEMQIAKIAENLPVFNSQVEIKNMKKTEDVPVGAVVSTNYLGKIRGVNFKPRKKNKRWFRNSFSVVVNVGEKFVNFKVCKNGTFQITGALCFEHATKCIECIWNFIKETNMFKFTTDENALRALIIPAMRNIDFNLNLIVNREAFFNFIQEEYDEYHCLLETSFGYTGLNVKKRIERPIEDLEILQLTFKDNAWARKMVKYTEYLDTLTPGMRKNKLEHTRYNTFLIFHSGKVIQSGLSEKFMKDDFYSFCKVIDHAYSQNQLEEKLEV
jgi:TATA-box binding protein (TBP) (component of TFIID and TFIIIB)